jgi:hypothetical protein
MRLFQRSTGRTLVCNPSLINAFERRVQLTPLSRVIDVARAAERHFRRMRRESLRRPDHVDPEEVDGHHEDEGMDRGGDQRCLARHPDTLALGRKCQKNAWAQNEEENRDQEMEHF